MATTAHSYERYKQGYEQAIANMQVRPEWQSRVNAGVDKIAKAQDKYKEVEAATGVPWQVIGVIHQLECGGRFDQHLHNGDSLTKRTWQVPRGRPKTGSPPFTWQESAIDALAYDGLTTNTDWSDTRVAYLFEKYNGFGYRNKGVNSAYLWSGSNHYVRGKYVVDGRWSSSAVSQQTGAMLLYLALKRKGPEPVPGKLSTPEVKKLKQQSSGFWLTRHARNLFRLVVPTGTGLAATTSSALDFMTSWRGMVAVGLLVCLAWLAFEYLDRRKQKDYAEGRHQPSGMKEESKEDVVVPSEPA